MIKEIYNNLLKDNSIKNIYDRIEKFESNNDTGYAYHNYNHMLNVTETAENILLSLKCDEDLIIKTKIACLFHDVGALSGKDNHAYKSYVFTKKYFKDNNIDFNGIDEVLEAIKVHSDGFNTDNLIALTLILADKLDIRSNRIGEAGKKVIGNRQYAHIIDVLINLSNDCLIINFITDGNIDMEELSNYYFTKKIFNAVSSFCSKLNLDYKVMIDNSLWNI